MRRQLERDRLLYPYLSLPCFADPLDKVELVTFGKNNLGRQFVQVPSEDRIRECCEHIRNHTPRDPIAKATVPLADLEPLAKLYHQRFDGRAEG